MSRKASPHEVQAAHLEREHIRLGMEDIAPKLSVKYAISRVDGSLRVSATVTGDTSPHTPEDVAYCLSELGAVQIEFVDTQTA